MYTSDDEKDVFTAETADTTSDIDIQEPAEPTETPLEEPDTPPVSEQEE